MVFLEATHQVLFYLIFFLFLSLPNSSLSSFSFNSSMPLYLSNQSSALYHFRNSFSVNLSYYRCDYYSYPPKNSWKMGTYCCGWDGVTCDMMTGHIIAINLSCSGLEGLIHPNSTIFSLRHLQRLNLAYNNFYPSTISSKFGGFTNMTHLNLAFSFASKVASKISHLSKMVSLDLSCYFGMMRIETPSLKRLIQTFLSSHKQITSLDLFDNNLGGQIPWSLLNFEGLTNLNLSSNNFIGQLPDLSTRKEIKETESKKEKSNLSIDQYFGIISLLKNPIDT